MGSPFEGGRGIQNKRVIYAYCKLCGREPDRKERSGVLLCPPVAPRKRQRRGWPRRTESVCRSLRRQSGGPKLALCSPRPEPEVLARRGGTGALRNPEKRRAAYCQ